MEKKEALNKRVGMWRQWAISFVFLGLTCFHAMCIAYPVGVLCKTFFEQGFPFKEVLVCALVGPSVLLSREGSRSILTQILEDTALKHNFKTAFNPAPHISFQIYESQFFGTDLYKEAAWAFTKDTIKRFVAYYGMALYFKVFSSAFEDLPLLTFALIIIFSAHLMCVCRECFRVNMNIALCLGEDEQVIV